MNKNDYIMHMIDVAVSSNAASQDSPFLNADDRAYRCEAVRQIFCGLRRDNQDSVLKFAMETLLEQNGLSMAEASI